jgi:RimJ/RimL family protein N-acetyltransferase
VERILIFIKHHLGFLWKLIEWGNGKIFCLLFGASVEKVLEGQLPGIEKSGTLYRRLEAGDAEKLHDLVQSQDPSDLKYFQPHDFDLSSIRKQFRKCSFLMMGAFDRDRLAGYFFLRFFANKKCFVGRLIDKPYRGKGIGNEMNTIMYQTAWKMGFRCLSTISKNNQAVIRAHAKNSTMVLLKELQNDYMLVEFVRK